MGIPQLAYFDVVELDWHFLLNIVLDTELYYNDWLEYFPHKNFISNKCEYQTLHKYILLILYSLEVDFVYSLAGKRLEQRSLPSSAVIYTSSHMPSKQIASISY